MRMWLNRRQGQAERPCRCGGGGGGGGTPAVGRGPTTGSGNWLLGDLLGDELDGYVIISSSRDFYEFSSGTLCLSPESGLRPGGEQRRGRSPSMSVWNWLDFQRREQASSCRTRCLFSFHPLKDEPVASSLSSFSAPTPTGGAGWVDGRDTILVLRPPLVRAQSLSVRADMNQVMNT